MRITIDNHKGLTQQCKSPRCWGFRFEKKEDGSITCTACQAPYELKAGEVEAPYPRVRRELWDRYGDLKRYSFFRGGDGTGTVLRQEDKTGNWVEATEVSTLIEEAQSEINSLKERLARLEPKVVK